MPRSFTDKEKAQIHSQLMYEGEKIFASYGLKKTTIEDITQAVGVAKGSFYLFFPSKEELFIEIFKKRERELRDEMVEKLRKPGLSHREIFEFYLRFQFEALEKNPVIKILLDTNEFKNIVRRLPEDKFQELQDIDDYFNENILAEFQDKGIIKPIPTKVINDALRSFFYMMIKKDEIGDEIYPRVMEMMIDMFVSYLVQE